MGFFSNIFVSRKKKLHRKIDVAIDQVKHGTYNELFSRYVERFDRDFSGMLAAAVTNTLFSEKPVGQSAEQFISENRPLVDQEVGALKDDTVIGPMVADAVQTRARVIYTHQVSGSQDKNFGKSIDLLRKLGFLKKQEEVSNPRLFMTKADKFFRASLKKVKNL